METEIISSENIIPSFPTPQNLRTYKLSMLDQIVPPILVPLVLYFPNTITQNPDYFTQLLKRSLSLILSRFYPLAGRVNIDGQSIECNDNGVPFLVVRITGHKLSDVLRNPDTNFLHQHLLPACSDKNNSSTDDATLTVQVSYFDCGGIAIGAVFSHKIADGTTIVTFLNSWAAATRGSGEAVCPNYITHSIFPYKEDMPNLFSSMVADLERRKSVTRRYAFDATAISSLKSKISGIIERPSRVEVVSALIWKCFITAISTVEDTTSSSSASVVTQSVNLRRRAHPPLPAECFGNLTGLAAARSENEDKKGVGELVRKLRDGMSKIDDNYLTRMRGDEGLTGFLENFQRLAGEFLDAEQLFVTSWCGVGFYGVDFGWGKPVWITRGDVGSSDSEKQQSSLNSVWLMDYRDGDGVEAWVTLDERYMAVFDGFEELRGLALVDPNPLDMSITSGAS